MGGGNLFRFPCPSCELGNLTWLNPTQWLLGVFLPIQKKPSIKREYYNYKMPFGFLHSQKSTLLFPLFLSQIFHISVALKSRLPIKRMGAQVSKIKFVNKEVFRVCTRDGHAPIFTDAHRCASDAHQCA